MNWEALSAVAELLGAVGVFASLVYLAIQIHQNNRWLKQQAYQLSTNELRRWVSHFSDSRETSELFLRGQRNYEALDPIERLQFTMIVFEMCSVWGTYQQYHDEDLLGMRASAEQTIRMWLEQGWFLGWYRANEYMLPADFKVFLEPLIERHSRSA